MFTCCKDARIHANPTPAHCGRSLVTSDAAVRPVKPDIRREREFMCRSNSRSADIVSFRCACANVRLSKCVDECGFASFREDNRSAVGVTSSPVQLYQPIEDRAAKIAG